MRDLIRAWAPSIVTSQENNIFDWFVSAPGLGTNWQYRRHSNSNVMWDSNQHQFLSYGQYDLPTPVGPGYSTRRMVGVLLRNKTTLQDQWVYSAHFMPGLGAFERDWQRQQMAACLNVIQSNDPANSFFGVDMNDDSINGPRLQARSHASRMYDLRNKLATLDEYGPGRVLDGDYNTYTGYNEPAREKKWIDDVFTGDNLLPYYFRMINTWTDDITDHAAQLVSTIRLV